MDFFVCDCTDGPRVRLDRRWWMRAMFPGRRFYRCSACRRTMLVRPAALDQAALRPWRRRLHKLIAPAIVLALTVSAGWLLESRFASERGTARQALGKSAPGAPECPRVHVYREGETLETIAEQELGAAWRAQDIAMFNREQTDERLKQGGGLVPGMAIQIPCAR